VVNDPRRERARAVAGNSPVAVVVLDSERRVVALSPEAERRLPGVAIDDTLGEDALVDQPGILTLFFGALPELSAYQELRMGFTAAVSHELRTPLARLLALLENATLPGSDVDALMEQAAQEVHETRELIDDVLFLGELETGREVVTLGHTAARPVVDEIVESLADRADHAGVTLIVDGDRNVELPLRPRMLRVVVENLLANSIRYAGQGRTCTIELTATASGPALTVSDDGSGVPATDLPRLFERFYRGDQARTSRGTGLGLAIVKHIVTSAGGTIGATSEPGQGLAIRISFPAAG
jgi:two-component system, OmpR family, phosphate regulon sensor histidine kinase PhoR